MSLGYTGNLMERELFHEVKKHEEMPPLEKYVPYDQALGVVKESQPYSDPSDPDPRFANDLHATVADMLQLDDYKKLKLYTAVGSHLDKWHKVDAFIEAETEKDNIIVTMDVTYNPDKGEEYGADIVFMYPKEGLDPKLKEDKEEYNNNISELAKRVVEKIKLQLPNKES